MRGLVDDIPKFSSSRDIWKTTQCIYELIASQFFQFLAQVDREVVMQKVLTFPLVLSSTPKHLKFSK
jgi:hypothetical protein